QAPERFEERAGRGNRPDVEGALVVVAREAVAEEVGLRDELLPRKRGVDTRLDEREALRGNGVVDVVPAMHCRHAIAATIVAPAIRRQGGDDGPEPRACADAAGVRERVLRL